MTKIENVDQQSGLEVNQWSMEVGLTIGMSSTVPSSQCSEMQFKQCSADQYTLDGFRLFCGKIMVQSGVGVLWYGMVWYGIAWHTMGGSTQRSGMVWYCMVWYRWVTTML